MLAQEAARSLFQNCRRPFFERWQIAVSLFKTSNLFQLLARPCSTVRPSPKWLRRPSKAKAARGRPRFFLPAGRQVFFSRAAAPMYIGAKRILYKFDYVIIK